MNDQLQSITTASILSPSFLTNDEILPAERWHRRNAEAAQHFLCGSDLSLDYCVLNLIQSYVRISNLTIAKYIDLIPLINANQLSDEDKKKIQIFHAYIRPYVEQFIRKEQ